jgi:hypothetical protein
MKHAKPLTLYTDHNKITKLKATAHHGGYEKLQFCALEFNKELNDENGQLTIARLVLWVYNSLQKVRCRAKGKIGA